MGCASWNSFWSETAECFVSRRRSRNRISPWVCFTSPNRAQRQIVQPDESSWNEILGTEPSGPHRHAGGVVPTNLRSGCHRRYHAVYPEPDCPHASRIWRLAYLSKHIRPHKPDGLWPQPRDFEAGRV